MISKPQGLLLALLGWTAGQGAFAQTVYKCVEPNGTVLFTDSVRSGCKALDLPSNSIAAPPVRSAPARKATTTTPSDFPRVDGAEQRERDDQRREILNFELRSEQRKLAELQGQFNNGLPERHGNEKNYVKYQERVEGMRANIERTESNIEALRRELANLK
jgi:hypothetical protein